MASSVQVFDTAADLAFSSLLMEISGGTLRLLSPYSTTNPVCLVSYRVGATSLTSFAESASKPAGTAIKYVLNISGTLVYWNSTTTLWTTASSIAYATANTASEINTNLPALLTDLAISGSFYLGVAVLLNSDGLATPTLTSITIGYNLTYPVSSTLSECLISCYLTDLLGDAYTLDASKPATLQVKSARGFLHGNRMIRPFAKSVTFDSSGLAQISVIETATPNELLQFSVTFYEGNYLKQVMLRPAIVPNLPTANLNNISSVTSLDFG